MHHAMSWPFRRLVGGSMALALGTLAAIPLWVTWRDAGERGLGAHIAELGGILVPTILLGGLMFWSVRQMGRMGAPPRRSIERLRKVRTQPEPFGAVGDWAD
jgi:hypothetical protein